MDYTYIGNRIASLLVERQISEYKLSTGIGRCCSYIQKITSGKCQPSIASLYAICDYLDMTPAEFFAPPSEDTPEIPGALKEALLGLSAKDMEKVIDYAKLLQNSKNNKVINSKTK